jgi:hypothetical protein
VSKKWYYTHERQTHGPISTAELKRRVAQGLLCPDDLIWPEGADPGTAVPVAAAVVSATSSRPAGALPDWLGDVAAAEQGAAGLRGKQELPSWLEDIRRVEDSPAKPAAAVTPGSTPPAEAPPVDPETAETGFDAQTGQIVDPVQFKKWMRSGKRKK